MPATLSAIGFRFDSDAELIGRLTPLVQATTQRLAVAPGDYGIWRSRSGAELWFHIEGERGADGELADGSAIGLTAHFEGSSEIGLRLEDAIRRPGDNPFEGAFRALVGADRDGHGGHPVVFDAVDFAAHAGIDLPGPCRARIAAFAMELAAYPDEHAFQREWPGEAKFAARSLIPIGLFSRYDGEAGADPGPPSSNAILNGVVLEYQTMHNEATGQAFQWLSVESAGGTFDVVVDPGIISGEIAQGAVVSAGCLLVGRVLDD